LIRIGAHYASLCWDTGRPAHGYKLRRRWWCGCNHSSTTRAGPGCAVVWAVSHAEMAELVTVDHRIDSDGSGGCIVQHRGWWRGDVEEQIGIDCNPVSLLVVLGAQGTGPLLESNEQKMTTRQAEADVAVRRKQSTHDSLRRGLEPMIRIVKVGGAPIRPGRERAEPDGLGRFE